MPPWIRHEHHQRWAFAARWVRGRVVVDCACGDGTGSAYFARAGAAAVLGIDVASKALALARGRHSDLRLAQGSALALPLLARTVDVFVSLETIEHLATGERGAKAFVDEVARVLKPNGIFVCSTPDRDVYNPGKTENAAPWNPFHVREYDRGEFTRILSRRFERVVVYGQNPRSRLLARALRLVGSLPGHLAVRCAQVSKMMRAPFDHAEAHAVVPARPEIRYEYLVAVCSGPR